MIHLTRLNHVPLVVNSDLIEHIEATPDTVLTLATGAKIVVAETPERVAKEVRAYRVDVLAAALGRRHELRRGATPHLAPVRLAAELGDIEHDSPQAFGQASA